VRQIHLVEGAGLGDNSVWTDELEASKIFAVEAIVTHENPYANPLLANADTHLLRCDVRIRSVAMDDVLAAPETGIRDNPGSSEEATHAASAKPVRLSSV